MARLTDSDIRARIEYALGLWDVSGYVTWKHVAATWVLDNLPGEDTKSIARRMFEHIRNGGGIYQVVERRPEYTEFQYHYDFTIRIGERLIYIETVLLDERSTEPTIKVVSIHDA